MEITKRLQEEWAREFARMREEEFMALLAAGRLELPHYLGFLRETYHNVSFNPKLMALFMAHLRSDLPSLEAKFLKHAAMEIGHDALALEDYRLLGGDADRVHASRPLPATEALTGFITFQIQHRNPLAYLGYLYHLEALPVQFGGEVIEALIRIGVPLEATSFLREHADADPVHLKWNREYLEGFVRSERDLEAVLYGLRGTCRLHAGMFREILEVVREQASEPAHPAVERP